MDRNQENSSNQENYPEVNLYPEEGVLSDSDIPEIIEALSDDSSILLSSVSDVSTVENGSDESDDTYSMGYRDDLPNLISGLASTVRQHVGGESKVESVIEEEKAPEVTTDMNSPLIPPAPSPKLFTPLTLSKSTETDTPSVECSICYKSLDITNIVNTTCKHTYCKKCFFRWMKTKTSCPMCRKNLISRTQWYRENSASDEIDELTELSENIMRNTAEELSKYNENKKINDDLMANNYYMRRMNNEELARKIRLNTDINYSRGYLKALNGAMIGEEFKKKIRSKSYKNCPYIHGYHAGYHERKHLFPNEKKEEEEQIKQEEQKKEQEEQNIEKIRNIIMEFDKNTQTLRNEIAKKYNINLGASKEKEEEEENEYENFDYSVVL